MPSLVKGSIDIEHVTHAFENAKGSRVAVEDVSLHIAPGEFVCIVGPSGCGKSTLLNLIAGFTFPTEGDVLVDGSPIEGPGADRGMVFQQHRLFPWMSVRDNVEYGPRMAGVSKAERRRISGETLAMVGLLDVADRPPYELSGGMQQRAAIARALCAGPEILLMDEPFSALDALTRERLQDELIEIWQRTNITIVFITHSVDEALYLGSRVVSMSPHPGRIVADQNVSFSSRPDFRASRHDKLFIEMRDELSLALRSYAV